MSLQSAISQLVNLVGDYRQGNIGAFDHNHVMKWLDQFDPAVHLELVSELNHVFGKSYYSQSTIEQIFAGLVNDPKFHGGNPRHYWASVSLLDIQHGGASQHEFVNFISGVCQQQHQVNVQVNSPVASIYWYIDDGLYSGNRVVHDLTVWIENSAPQVCHVELAFINLHGYGHFDATRKLAGVIARSGKTITLNWLWCAFVEDRKYYNNSSDVLRPVSANFTPVVLQYISAMKHPPIYRQPGGKGGRGYYSSEAGRHLLEQLFLEKGVYIRNSCPHLKIPHRPLGYSSLDTLGFGAMCITYRNCPNNAPLALWVGNPWYPLFPRSTNADARFARILEAL